VFKEQKTTLAQRKRLHDEIKLIKFCILIFPLTDTKKGGLSPPSFDAK
jgi:hypothetical protein